MEDGRETVYHKKLTSTVLHSVTVVCPRKLTVGACPFCLFLCCLILYGALAISLT